MSNASWNDGSIPKVTLQYQIFRELMDIQHGERSPRISIQDCSPPAQQTYENPNTNHQAMSPMRPFFDWPKSPFNVTPRTPSPSYQDLPVPYSRVITKQKSLTHAELQTTLATRQPLDIEPFPRFSSIPKPNGRLSNLAPPKLALKQKSMSSAELRVNVIVPQKFAEITERLRKEPAPLSFEQAKARRASLKEESGETRKRTIAFIKERTKARATALGYRSVNELPPVVRQ